MTKKEEDFIKEFSGERDIHSQFLIKSKEMKKTKDNKSYIELILKDKTGTVKGLYFLKRPYKVFEKIELNSIWHIIGQIREYPENSGKYNIIIRDMHHSKRYNKDDFKQVVENYDSHMEYLFNTINSIRNPYLKKLLDSFFDDETFENMFLMAPAAKIHHHNYKGGLLVHTNEVIEICKTVSNIYEDIDYDLLMTGAILHDIGKIKAYDYETDDIKIKYEDRMMGHLFIGANMVENKLKNIDMPDKLKINLINMILSHHGEKKLGWGSCVDPKTPEAIALHHADDMSAKITKSIENKI